MMSVLKMMRLGLVLSGTNGDLGPRPGDDPEDSDTEGGGSGSGEEGDEESETEGGGSGSDSKAEGDEFEGKGKGKGSDDGDDSPEGGDSEGGAEGDAEGEGDEAEGGGMTRPGDGTPDDAGEASDEDVGDDGPTGPASGGGKGSGDSGPKDGGTGGVTGEDLGDVAAELLNAMEAGEESGLKDNNSALQDSLEGEAPDHLEGECPWNPYSTEKDSIYRPSKTEPRKQYAQRLKRAVKTEIATISAKLRNKFLQANREETIHGVRKGVDLSERRLVSSMVELRSGRRPTRPDWQRVQKPACTLATAVVVDESGSMSGGNLLKSATMACIAISEALDRLGAPVLVVGPRNAGAGYEWPSWSGEVTYQDQYHRDEDGNVDYNRPKMSRTDSVVIDIFKDWHERSSDALPRFAAIQACGSTPLSDGIQFALQELQERTERHRVVFVITDGHPDNSACVRWQIRTAAEAGVTVVGIGIGDGASYVKNMFPVSVWSRRMDGLPAELLKVLEGIMFPRRARKMNLGDKKMKAS